MKRNFVTILVAVLAAALILSGVAKARSIDPIQFQTNFTNSEAQPGNDRGRIGNGTDDKLFITSEVQLTDDKGVDNQTEIQPGDDKGLGNQDEVQPGDDKGMDDQNEILLGDDKSSDRQNEVQLGDDRGVDNNGGTPEATAEPQLGDDHGGTRHSRGGNTGGQIQPGDDKGGHGSGG
jgi:hypothetical protein